jgi:tRNA A-37 threonylcarbamoyl transferase component Bud32
MFTRWQEEAGDGAGNLARFAAWMVANKYVTEYQASLLARGHAEGFFLGDYKILERLGKGRMAGVYRAQHQSGQVVALKVLPPSKARDPELFGRFRREAALALRLKHPNIVRAFQTDEANGLHYLVMEYLEGETLSEVLARRGRLPPAEAVRLLYQALQGLDHIHRQGLVHRDLKPANLMLIGSAPDSTLRATLKILDIGLGRVLFEEGSNDLEPHPELTGEGVLLGTPDYMAPEQARDPRAIDIRSDIYSLGCVLYHALAGRPPFPDSNVITQMIRHATEPARPLKELNPAVPDGLQQIVNWMMAKDPNGRYPTPERAAQALQVFLAAGSEPAAVPEADPGMRRFLTLLEAEDRKGPAPIPAPAQAAAAPPSTVPDAPAAPAAPQPRKVKPARPASEPAAAAGAAPPGKDRHKRHRRQRTRHTLESEAIDVELVALSPPEPVGKSGRGWHLSRRDFAVFCSGVAAGGLATFLGWLIANHFRRDRGPNPEPGEAEEPGKKEIEP